MAIQTNTQTNYEQTREKLTISEEYIKGLLNPCFMIEKYIKTVDGTQGGFVPFKLFPKQRELIYSYETHRHNVVTKPRQTGISTTTAAYLAVKAAYAKKESPECIVIIANKFTSAKKFVTSIRLYLSQLPKWIWGDAYDYDKKIDGHIVGIGAKESITLVNGTIIIALATSKDALRTYTPTYLVLDEAAYIKTDAKELYTASIASLSVGGKMIVISTPNGKDELYYPVCMGAKSGDNGFNMVQVYWYQDPRYNKDLKWHKLLEDGTESIVKEIAFEQHSYDLMIRDGYKPSSSWYLGVCAGLNGDKIAIAREYDVKFEGSAGTVVEQEWIEYHERINVRPLDKLVLKDYNDALWLYEEPLEGHQYIMGVDVSSGNADDFSAMSMFDINTGHQVLEYKAKIRPQDLAEIVFKYGNLFNSLTIVDTTGGYGDNLILKLEEYEYKLLYYNKGQQEYRHKFKNQSQDKNKLVAGYKISSMRPQIIGKLTEYIENNTIKIRSMRFIAELETFIWKNGRPDHMNGFNDDIIFASALALWILETEFKSLEKAKAQTAAILSILGNNKDKTNEKAKIESNLPFGKQTDKDGNAAKLYRSAQDPTGAHSWIFR